MKGREAMTAKRLFRVRLSGRGGPLFRAAAEQIVGREGRERVSQLKLVRRAQREIAPPRQLRR